MKVQIINKYKIQWEDNYKKVFEKQGWDVAIARKQEDIDLDADVRIFMWADKMAVDTLNQVKDNRNIVFVRRYEYFTGAIEMIPWDKVSKAVFVNDVFAESFEKRIGGIKPTVIYNGVDPDAWTFKERAHGKKIAVVGYVNLKKNLPLAMQILAELPRDYEMHLAGAPQDGATVVYVNHLAETLGLNVTFAGQVRSMDKWLEDKNYLLSTAISEGCPNNVIEAMAKGIKPVVHNWPGAEQIFGPLFAQPGNKEINPNLVFNTVDEACVALSPRSEYDSDSYRARVKDRHGWGQYDKVLDLIMEAVK